MRSESTKRSEMQSECVARFATMRVAQWPGSRVGSKGGSARQRLTVGDIMELCAPENAIDCRRLLGISIAEVRTRKMTTSMAHAIASLAGVFLKAADQGDLESRVQRLEQVSEERKHANKPN